MIPYAELPAFNALLNAICTVLLLTGYAFIRKKKIALHRLCMSTAFALSILFLTSYITYHLHTRSTIHFQRQGWIRTVYFSILTSHMSLAVLILPLVIRTLYLALKGRVEAHRRLARWTLPLWLYVTITGVVIYEMLFY